MSQFTPISSMLGGMLIGLAAVLLMLLNGRIAGVSGITAGLLSPTAVIRDAGWRLAFVAGLIAAPILLGTLGVASREINFVVPLPAMIAAGVIVGFGTVLGNGCTSGHGVCGIARLSPRSIAATIVFMAAAIATTFIIRHL